MQLLLDTHAFIWFINGDKHLSEKIIDDIKNVKNTCYVSIASIWEIAIKLKLNKLEFDKGFDSIRNFILKNEISILPITIEHIIVLNSLDFHHRDPFDRIIISQGISERLTIISKDQNFNKYNVEVLW